MASCKLFYQRTLSKGVNPLWRGDLIWVGSNFGSGIAGFFTQWRDIALLNLLIVILWIPLAFLHWFESTEMGSKVSLSFGNASFSGDFWSSSQVYWPEIMGFTSDNVYPDTSDQAFMFGPWYYTGYQPEMNSINMGAMWVFATLGTVLLSFLYFEVKLSAELSASSGDIKKDELMPWILSGLDFSMNSEQGVRDGSRVMIVKWLSVLHGTYHSPHIFTAEDVAQDAEPVPKEKQGLVPHCAIARVQNEPELYASGRWKEGGEGPGKAVRLWHEAQSAREVNRMSNEEKIELVSKWTEANPDAAKKDPIKESPPGADDTEAPAVDPGEPVTPGPAVPDPEAPAAPSEGEAAGSEAGAGTGAATGAIINITAAEAQTLGATGAEKIQSGLVPYFIVAKKHDAVAEEGSVLAGKAGGIFLSVCFMGGTFFGVYLATSEATMINKETGGFGVALIIACAQNVIPQIVKLLVSIEGWTKAEDMLFQLLWRTYFLKMVNFFITVNALTSAKMRTQCLEADMASQLLNLIFMDFAVYLVATPLTGILTELGTGEKPPMDHTTVAQFYIDMNYRQALVFTAVPYVPLAPLYAFVAHNIMFSVQTWTMGQYYKAADKPFEDNSGGGTLILLMATIAIAFLPQANWLMGEAGYCGPIQGSAYTSTYGVNIRYEAAVSYVYSRSPLVVRNIFKMVLNPMVIYSGLVVLIFIVNLVLQKNIGLQAALTSAEKEVQGAINLWRDELVRNKALQGPPSPKKTV